jgi:hypothetical protein
MPFFGLEAKRLQKKAKASTAIPKNFPSTFSPVSFLSRKVL